MKSIITAAFLFLVLISIQQTFAGTPIKGQIVKGGKGPSCACKVIGTTNEKGEVKWNITEAGNYILQVEGAGLIVKALKNDGTSTVIAITKDKGDIEWKDVNPGNYVLQLAYNDAAVLDSTAPTVVKPTRYTIKTKAATNAMVETAMETDKPQAKGQPVRGQIVKGGKNPSGVNFALPTKDDGSFGIKLEEGAYTISMDAEELKKTIAALKSKDETINGATFVFDLPANFTFSGTEKANKKGEYVAPKYTFEITVPKEGILFAGKLLTTTTAGLSITPTVNERGSGSPKQQGF